MAKTPSKTGSILSLKVTLRGIRPPIWRRLLIPDDMTLGDLSAAIQAAMGWNGGHLHVFDIGGTAYGDPDYVEDAAPEERMTLKALAKAGVARFSYTYDFGDDWEHSILIERSQPPDPALSYPACIAGKRNCPPEDCGGIWGYQHLLEVMADPTHPEYEEQSEWLEEDFDPEDFSVTTANTILATRFGQAK